jgi:hypothetical protein
MYKGVQIWPGQTVTCLHTNRPGHIWTSLYMIHIQFLFHEERSAFALETPVGYVTEQQSSITRNILDTWVNHTTWATRTALSCASYSYYGITRVILFFSLNEWPSPTFEANTHLSSGQETLLQRSSTTVSVLTNRSGKILITTHTNAVHSLRLLIPQDVLQYYPPIYA